MSLRDPYRGRRAEAGRVKAILRESSRQPDGKLPKAAKGGIGDTTDAWLKGTDGMLHPQFDKQRTGRR